MHIKVYSKTLAQMPLSIGLRMELTEKKLKMRNRKKASCCDWSALVTRYQYLLKSRGENYFEFLVVF
jgi:hypothetical protein